ncbi:MAG: UDP-glucose--hexose-1-phosphate uridylyltransferase [Spirochaetales bacterium]|nr:UDP-glucose--hexose-1-phosphate uridylyltransferase [Spirochaetales bacterium]
MSLLETSHRRYNPLTDEWILVSPHRTKRPWQGGVEKTVVTVMPDYDPECYLCPGNRRNSGEKNPDYTSTFSFDNDFPALMFDQKASESTEELFQARPEGGRCRVLCYSPSHSLTMAKMNQTQVAQVIELWIEEYQALKNQGQYASIQIFENRGAMMGCSNPHPHGQLWANENLPNLWDKEMKAQAAYYEKHGRALLLDYVEKEIAKNQRLVFRNDSFAVLVPFWAIWPFETMILPRFPLGALDELGAGQKEHLAEALRSLTCRYDNLFLTDFPYSMGIHSRPLKQEAPGWQLHFHFYPPLLRSATIKKFMVGYELLAMAQRDITAESAAARLAELSDVHFSQEDSHEA